jgi:hypothetical protein
LLTAPNGFGFGAANAQPLENGTKTALLALM